MNFMHNYEHRTFCILNPQQKVQGLTNKHIKFWVFVFVVLALGSTYIRMTGMIEKILIVIRIPSYCNQSNLTNRKFVGF